MKTNNQKIITNSSDMLGHPSGEHKEEDLKKKAVKTFSSKLTVKISKLIYDALMYAAKNISINIELQELSSIFKSDHILTLKEALKLFNHIMKQLNKRQLSNLNKAFQKYSNNPNSSFDEYVKEIHEKYKLYKEYCDKHEIKTNNMIEPPKKEIKPILKYPKNFDAELITKEPIFSIEEDMIVESPKKKKVKFRLNNNIKRELEETKGNRKEEYEIIAEKKEIPKIIESCKQNKEEIIKTYIDDHPKLQEELKERFEEEQKKEMITLRKPKRKLKDMEIQYEDDIKIQNKKDEGLVICFSKDMGSNLTTNTTNTNTKQDGDIIMKESIIQEDDFNPFLLDSSEEEKQLIQEILNEEDNPNDYYYEKDNPVSSCNTNIDENKINNDYKTYNGINTIFDYNRSIPKLSIEDIEYQKRITPEDYNKPPKYLKHENRRKYKQAQGLSKHMKYKRVDMSLIGAGGMGMNTNTNTIPNLWEIPPSPTSPYTPLIPLSPPPPDIPNLWEVPPTPSVPLTPLIPLEPKPIQSKKSKKVRRDIYGSHYNDERNVSMPMVPASNRSIIDVLNNTSFDLSRANETDVKDQEEEPMVGDYEEHTNKRMVKGKDQRRGEYIEFDEEGAAVIQERKPVGRPKLAKGEHKYEKKYNKRGRPSKEQILKEIEEFKKPEPEPEKIARQRKQKVKGFKRQVTKKDIAAVRIGQIEFKRRRKEVRKGIIRGFYSRRDLPAAAEILERGRNLDMPLSDQLIKVLKRTTHITSRKKIQHTNFVFHYDRRRMVENLDLSNEDNLRAQTNYLEEFIQRAMNLPVPIRHWRMIVHYDSPGGNNNKVSTVYGEDYEDVFDELLRLIRELFEHYNGEENVYIHQFEVEVIENMQALIGGSSYKEVKEKIQKIKESWCIINPSSKWNCLWTSVYIANRYSSNPNLLTNIKLQNEKGSKLKKLLGTRNWRGGTEEDIQKCCNYIKKNIEIYDDFLVRISTFKPEGIEETEDRIRLLIQNCHYHVMLEKEDPMVKEYYKEIKRKIKHGREIDRIKPLETIKDPQRIVVYDLESWRNPIEEIKILPHNEIKIQTEIHQEAYAVGWCFEVKDIEEEVLLEQEGYTIRSYEFMGKTKAMAYKRLLGDLCLDQALREWLSLSVFHHAVFYAHNGGKFDIRLIMGQSDLLYKEEYVIVDDKTIELNGRIINMDIENITIDYEKPIYNKNGKKIRTNKEQHRISLRDSLPLFGPGNSLAKLCTELNVPHKKLEQLVNVHDLMFKDTWRENWIKYEMDKYLENDCLGLLEVLLQFNETVMNESGISITAVNTGASLSKKFFLKNYYKPWLTGLEGSKFNTKKTIHTLSFDMDSFIRQGYAGGRCESFISKEMIQDLYYYDFTSLYPDVARNPLPTGPPKYINIPRMVQHLWKNHIIERNESKIKNESCFWKVKVRSPLAMAGRPLDPKYRKPLFGLKEENMYVFRWFDEWTELVIFEPEILLAIDEQLDYEFEPIEVIRFHQYPIMKECMENLFEKKALATRNKQTALAQTWKIIINSLYGVWGLKIKDREGVEISRPEKSNWAMDLVSNKLMDIEKIGKYVVTRRKKDLPVKECNVAIAAAICSYARIKLYKLFVDIQNAQEEIIYCDTDSVVTTCCIEENPMLKDKWMGSSLGKDLGTLKNEIVECIEKYNKKNPTSPLPARLSFQQAIIISPKLYYISAYEDKIVKKAHKGYKETEEDKVTYERMKKLIDKNIPPEDRYMKQNTIQWLGGNKDIVRNNIGVRLIERTKYTKQTINKGLYNEETGEILPFTKPKSSYDMDE